MRAYVGSVLLIIALAVSPRFALAAEATVNVSSNDVQSGSGVLTITTALPLSAVGMRLNRAFLEVPIAVSESANEVFNAFPMLELYEDGSELPKQSILLSQGHTGVVRIDVTRFVRTWSDSEARAFVLGSVSEHNETAFGLGSADGWAVGTKARLIVEYVDRDGTSASAIE